MQDLHKILQYGIMVTFIIILCLFVKMLWFLPILHQPQDLYPVKVQVMQCIPVMQCQEGN